MNFYIVTYMDAKDENKNVADILLELENLEYIYKLKRLLEIQNRANYNKITIGRWSVKVNKMNNTEVRKFGIVEAQFDYMGHDCICIFTSFGYRCGYVSVSTSVNDEQYEDLYEDIYCHCGLSFIGPLPYEYGQKEKCYIGFDCGHICDGRDYDTAIEYGLIDEKEKEEQLEAFKYLIGREIATLDYVEQQCKHIVDQLIERGIE